MCNKITDAILVDVKLAQHSFLGDRSCMEFMSLGHSMQSFVNVENSNKALFPTEETYEIETRWARKVGDKYVIWSPEFEDLIGQPLAKIDSLETSVEVLRASQNNLMANYHERGKEIIRQGGIIDRKDAKIKELEDSLQKWKVSWFCCMAMTVTAVGAVLFGT